jgi:hypothetical protein
MQPKYYLDLRRGKQKQKPMVTKQPLCVHTRSYKILADTNSSKTSVALGIRYY